MSEVKYSLDSFSPEPSDYVLPPSHKVIILLDHGPIFSKDSGCQIPVVVKQPNKGPPKKVGVLKKTMWSCVVEATIEVHRVIADLFPDGSRLIRFVLADFVGRYLTPEWGNSLINLKELMKQLASTGPASEGDESSCSVMSGATMAIEAISVRTDLHTRLSQLPDDDLISVTRQASCGFAWNMKKPEKGRRPAVKLLNKGSILLFTAVKSDEEVAELEKDIDDCIKSRNKIIGGLDDSSKTFLPIDHINLFIFNVHPVGTERTVTSKSLTNVSPLLSSSVMSCVAEGEKLLQAVHAILLPLYDLVSTTVTGIPMKEEAQPGVSVNYDVELLHSRIAHVDLARHGLLAEKDSPTESPTVDCSSAASNSEAVAGNTAPKAEEKAAAAPPRLISVAPSGMYKTIRLTWATPTPKTRWNLFPRTRRSYPVTPSLVTSRPSVCLTSFLAAGRNVMLEVKGAASADKNLKPNVGSKLISHTLIAHGGRIYIHAIAISRAASVLDNKLLGVSCGMGKIPTGLRVSDFCGLIKEMMLRLPKPSQNPPAALAVTDKRKEEEIPNEQARRQSLRLTRYWPLRTTNTFIFHFAKKFEPLLSLIKLPELSTADVDKCKQVIKQICGCRESSDLLTYTKTATKLVKNLNNREEQLTVALKELAAHLGNYVNHSERHLEVFRMFAQLSGESLAASMPVTDIDLKEEDRKQLLLIEDDTKYRRIRRNRLLGLVEEEASGEEKKTEHEKESARSSAAKSAQKRKESATLRVPERPSPTDSRSTSPQPKKPRKPHELWAVNETRSVYDLLCQRQSQCCAPSRPWKDFVGRQEAGDKPAKLYPQLEGTNLRAGKGMVEG